MRLTRGSPSKVPVTSLHFEPLRMRYAMSQIAGKNRIMIYGPKTDGTYVVEFRTADGEALAMSIPSGETAVLKHFQERMPYGVFVPDGP
jgi:hypothetical protein